MKYKFNLSYYLIFTLISTTLFLNPASFDPIVIPRLTFLLMSGSIAIFIILKNIKNNSKTSLTIEIKILLVFISWLVVSSLVSKNSISDSIFGNERRNLGLLSCISLTAIILLLLFHEKISINSSILNTLIVAVSINSAYSLLQHFNFDPLPWSSNNSGTFGFFGNPNFSSVFSAMGCVAVFTKLFENNKLWKKALVLIFFLLNLYVIDSTKSLQGVLTLIIALTIILMLKIFNSFTVLTNKKKKKFTLLGCVFVVLLLLVSIKNQILSFFRSEETFLYRLEYFKAGKNMLLQNPIFGVGISGFRDNYRLYREKSSLQYTNYLDEVDSSHNLLIDLFASGGLILGTSYLLFICLVIFRMYSHVLNNSVTNDEIAIIGVWFVILIQSLISPPNLTLLIWGFVLSGLIVKFSDSDSNIKNDFQAKISLKSTYIPVFLAFLVTLPLNLNDYRFRSSLESGRIESIKLSLTKWPYSEKNLYFTAQLFRENGLFKESIDLATRATNVNSNYFESWLFLIQSNQFNEQEKILFLRNLSRLDPLYPSYGKIIQSSP
jgi:O-antigen ligase